MHTVKLCLTSDDASELHDVEVEFDPEEVKVLKEYLSNCDRLGKSKIFDIGFPTVRSLGWTGQDGLKFEVSDFEYSNVCELLHLARPIFLSSEPASFEKTQGVIGKRAAGTALTTNLKHHREMYERGDYQPYFQVTVGKTPLFHDSTVKAWLNGVEYHQDAEKRAIIAALERSLSTNVAQGIFISQLSGRIRAIYMLAELCKALVSGVE